MTNKTHYLREWRKFRGLTLERVAGRLDLATSTLSRIERGEISYTQPNIEALAVAYNCEPADLFRAPQQKRPPLPPEIIDLAARLTPDEREQAARVLRAMFQSAA